MTQPYLRVRGGKTLNGSVRVPGAKNAITKQLVASLLSDQKCTFYNVPNIGDVEVTVELCRELGSQIEWNKQEQTLVIQTPKLKTSYIPQRYCGSNRIPILLIGALLGRSQDDIIVPTVGGCNLGKRPVDFHIQALEKLGADIEHRHMRNEGAYFARAHKGLKGTLIELDYPSVGATENSILAAVRAEGTTRIENAAMEPEIIDLILFLQKMGASIHIDTDRSLIIHGTNEFYPVEHRVINDRNIAISFACAAIATQGRVFVEGADHIHLITFLNKLRQVGAGFSIKDNGIEFFYKGPLKGGIHLETDVHPGFMTDWQQPFSVLLSQASGASIIHETVYENRFGYLNALIEMGANVQLFDSCLGPKTCRFFGKGHTHSAMILGPTPLQGGEIQIPDLRAGFAYVQAALIAKGESKIYGLSYLDRGYDDLIHKLQSIGADIERVDENKTKKAPIQSEATLVATSN